jgi:DNA processing protein
VSERHEELSAILNLLSVDGIGSATVLKLVNHFGSARAAFGASEMALRSLPRFSEALAARLHGTKADAEFGRKQLEKCAELGVQIVTFWDSEYPTRLKTIENDAPAILFSRGPLAKEAKRLAVVGTRSATAYGKRVTQDLIRGLRGSGVHIVSGLASGIDGTAHEASLEAGLVTEAIFGCGVDIVYPPANTSLAHRILAAGGALVSEYPLGTTPDRSTFPQRNRIIAGLAAATIVIEAGDKSGALITATLAVEYNREVMAVPGAVNNPKVRGCHRLIKDGAALIEKPEDILELLEERNAGRPAAQQQLFIELPAAERQIFEALDVTEATHIDALAEKTGVHVGDALGKLLMLELKGVVRQLPGKYFVRA